MTDVPPDNQGRPVVPGAGAGGKAFWRGLDDLADTPRFRSWLETEFPAAADALAGNPVGRRQMMRAMAASALLGGLAACDDTPPEEAVPYIRQPEFAVPGRPRFYASAVALDGFLRPVLAETHDGRPTRLDGNPDHPVAGAGRSDAFLQAEILSFYDPDRSRTVLEAGRTATWSAVEARMIEWRARWAERGGEGLAVLTGPSSSPTAARQWADLHDRYPRMRRYVHDPAGTGKEAAAMEAVFGRRLAVHPRLDRAAAVVCLGADPLGPGPHQPVLAARWADRRRAALENRAPLNRLWVAEPSPSLTGTRAAARLPIGEGRLPALAAELAARLGVGTRLEAPDLSLGERLWLESAAEALEAAGPDALILAGSHLPPAVQALAFAIDRRLGAIGRTVEFTEPVVETAGPDGGLEDLAEAIRDGAVGTLVTIDANPAYTAPGALGFVDLLRRVPLRLHAGRWADETAYLSHWHLPLTHALESWSDGRAADGTATLVQPTIRPLYQGRTVHEVLGLLSGAATVRPRDPVRSTWAALDQEAWVQALHDGYVPDTAPAPVEPPPIRGDASALPEPASPDTIEALVRPDPSIWDGVYANNAWLQELPKPLDKLTWENGIAVAPAFAAARGLGEGERVSVTVGEATVAGPLTVLPGQDERTVVLTLGYGRRRAGRVGSGLGYDAYALLPATGVRRLVGAVVAGTGEAAEPAVTQLHFSLEHHERVIQTVPPDRLGERVEPEPPPPSLFPDWDYPDEAWAMSIDLDLCIGCNACVTACQAENNIPVVGPDQVRMGREMHWLRVDRYYEGSVENPVFHFQPLPCMHCEKAPCEMGCPVNATVHGPDDLNQMIYNRCIGTRTCSASARTRSGGSISSSTATPTSRRSRRSATPT